MSVRVQRGHKCGRVVRVLSDGSQMRCGSGPEEHHIRGGIRHGFVFTGRGVHKKGADNDASE